MFPILKPGTDNATEIRWALQRCPLAWVVTTEHLAATDTEGTMVRAWLHWPSASYLCGYRHDLGANGNHLAAALALLANHGSDPVQLLSVDDISGGYRFTFGRLPDTVDNESPTHRLP